MQYDPVKDRLQRILGKSAWARLLFFAVLDRLFLRARYVHRELARLKRSGFEPTRILDAGSGFGQYSLRASKIFPQAQIMGLDVKADLVASGNDFFRKLGSNPPDRILFIEGDLLNMPYDSQFDLVLSVDVMEHIEEDRRVFDNIGRALKYDGLFIMTTPFFDGTARAGKVSDQPFVDEHVRPGYSKADLAEKLNKAGMELKTFVITYGHYGSVAWKLLQRGPMSWLAGRIWLAPLVAVYLLFAYPVAWCFMQLDMATQNTMGGGILAVAKKSVNDRQP